MVAFAASYGWLPHGNLSGKMRPKKEPQISENYPSPSGGVPYKSFGSFGTPSRHHGCFNFKVITWIIWGYPHDKTETTKPPSHLDPRLDPSSSLPRLEYWGRSSLAASLTHRSPYSLSGWFGWYAVSWLKCFSSLLGVYNFLNYSQYVQFHVYI